jgi:hypothetical protein
MAVGNALLLIGVGLAFIVFAVVVTTANARMNRRGLSSRPRRRPF